LRDEPDVAEPTPGLDDEPGRAGAGPGADDEPDVVVSALWLAGQVGMVELAGDLD
jgi:hypothetical protein